jgi:hypothetical protein
MGLRVPVIMIRHTIFPETITDASDQSRTLGADLSALLAGREIATFVNNRELLLEAMYELWLNLPCLTHPVDLLCFPLYDAYFELHGRPTSGKQVLPSPDNEDYLEGLLLE